MNLKDNPQRKETYMQKNIMPKPKEYKTALQWKKQGYKLKKYVTPSLYWSVCKDGKRFVNEHGDNVAYYYFSPDEVELDKNLQTNDYKVTDYKKIKSIHDVPDIASSKNIVCFDCETTGLAVNSGDELLQLTLVNDKTILFEKYLKPHKKKSWYYAMKVNHITPKMVENEEYPETYREQVQNIFDNADYIVGHNVSFDINFVTKGMGIHIPKEKVIDTLSLYKQISPSGSHHLKDAVTQFCPEELETFIAGAHNASTDAKYTLIVLRKMQQQLLEEKQNEYER